MFILNKFKKFVRYYRWRRERDNNLYEKLEEEINFLKSKKHLNKAETTTLLLLKTTAEAHSGRISSASSFKTICYLLILIYITFIFSVGRYLYDGIDLSLKILNESFANYTNNLTLLWNNMSSDAKFNVLATIPITALGTLIGRKLIFKSK